MTHGIKVSRPGYDVTTASDGNKVYSSEFSTISPYMCMRFETAGDEEHGLDYAPIFFFVVEYGQEPDFKMGVSWPSSEIADNMYFTSLAMPAFNAFYADDVFVSVDDTKVYCDVLDEAEVDAIYVFICHEPLGST